ncbi:MAG: mechanosensitive ion channel family protein [Mucinivorans sp.]
METVAAKFWLVEDFWQFLHQLGISTPYANLLAFIAACAILAILIWLIDVIIIRVALAAIKQHSKRTKTDWDDVLVQHKFFAHLFQLLPLLVVLWANRVIFEGFSTKMIVLVDTVVKAMLIVVVLLVFYSLLNSWNDMFMRREVGQRKSVKGYVQVAKILLGCVAGILVVSILVHKDPSTLLLGLGTAAALIGLVFKDTILGFVASIQLSAQDMVRPGDWIEMPSKNADGTVLDINVNSVKVQNWNNTITMIPIYSMVSESFTNWRGMEESAGRRFVRQFNIDISSVHLATDEFMERLATTPITASGFDEFSKLAMISSPEALTNMALLRANIELFLRSHPSINDELPLYVRYTKDIADKGIGVELYAFSREKNADRFDTVQRSLVEYVVAVAPLFDIVLFQSPSGQDFAKKL